jgi:carboxypeptidase T
MGGRPARAAGPAAMTHLAVATPAGNGPAFLVHRTHLTGASARVPIWYHHTNMLPSAPMERRAIRATGILLFVAMGCNGGDVPEAGNRQAPAVSADEPAAVRIYFTDRDELNALAGEKAPWEVHHDQGYAIFEVDGQAEIEELRNIGYRVEIDHELTAEMNAPAPEDIGLLGIPGFSCYRTVEETYAAAAAIASNHPTLATWTDIGNSWRKNFNNTGYDINVLRLTNQSVPGPKPIMFAMAAIHAREYTTAELLTRFAEHLVNNYGTDPDVTWMLDHHEFHLVLQSNPDGRKFAEGGQLWRKNTNQSYCGATSSSRGADLNRNYPFQWTGSGSSTSPCSETYRGASPASEPETQAIRDYVRAIFPDQRDESLGAGAGAPANATGLFFDIHSYSELVLWPWGYTNTNSGNNTAFRTLGRKFAFFNDYTPQKAIDLYVTNGTTDDFAYGELGVAAYTFELGTSFFQSCSAFENTVFPDNMAALLYAGKVARTPYQTPAGPEALNVSLSATSVVRGQPVQVTANLNDGRFNNSNGTEPTQAVAGGTVYVGAPPWSGTPPSVAMTPRDGNFNSTIEIADGTIDTSVLQPGRHLIYVEGRDAQNNRGPVSAKFLDVLPSSGNQPPAVNIIEPGDNSPPVHFGTAVTLFGSASDFEDGNLSSSIVWTSSIDGQLATGSGAWAFLSIGTHTITASVTDSAGTPASDSVTVTVEPLPTFLATFEDGAAGWTTSGLWHLTSSTTCVTASAPSAPSAMYYGQDSSCNYDVGITSGNLTSPVITNITASSVLSFNYFRKVESNSSTYDVTAVDVLVGSSSTTVFTRSSANPSVTQWQSSGPISLAAFAGQPIQLRFRFHSRNSLNNNHTGWVVDDIMIDE